MTRVVIDTSVFVSALIGNPGAAPDQIVRAFVEDRLEVVVSARLLDELERVLARPKLRRYLEQQQADEYVTRIRRHAVVANDPDEVQAATRDPNDDYIVALARQARVDAIISVDLDLIACGIDEPPVWTPRQATDRLAQEQRP